jgi:DNA-binding transcriptional ArsR family regulator
VDAYREAQFDALGDATRRAILKRLLNGPSPVGKIAAGLPVSRPAISQHLRVLERAQLVTYRSAGTRRVYQLDPRGIDSLREYFDRLWSQALAAFRAKVEEESE